MEILENKQLPRSTALTDWPNGGSSVFRKSSWQKLGGFDELFSPFYFEDIDLGIRATKAGLKCLWEPNSVVDHQHEATINPQNLTNYHRKESISLIKERNQLLLTWKNIDNTKSFLEHFRFLIKRTLSHPGYFRIILMSLARKVSFANRCELHS